MQIGGCSDANFGSCPLDAAGISGDLWAAILTNDDRARPETITPGNATKTNAGATLEDGEPDSCGNAEYDKTVWFRYVAAAEGDVTYSTSVVDTVISAYRGSSTSPLDCNDNAGDVNSAEISFHVEQGESYFIQVGGKSDAGGVSFGGFTHRLGFVPDLDHDNDGYNRPPGPDCNDNNAGIHPNAASVTGNGVDENCDGSDPPFPIPPVDRDGDGSPAGQDCDDANRARRPGNTEIRGNGRDEDCVGGDLPYLRLGASYAISGVWGAFGRFTRLELRNVEAGSTVRIRCRGKGCRRKTITRRVRKAARRIQFAKAMRRNRPRPGARVEVRVTKPGKIGKLFTYRIRSFKEPVERTLCLPPGASRGSRGSRCGRG